MLLTLLTAVLASAAPAPSAPPPTAVTPVVIEPLKKGAGPPPAATVEMQTDENAMGVFASIWPEGAYQARIAGAATLSCLIDAHGIAEWCQVVSETPQGKGFGRAAMMLRPTFKLAPAMGPDGPMSAMMTIAIKFKPPDPQFNFVGSPQGNIADCGGAGKPCPELHMVGNPLQRRSVTVLDHPIWAAAASFEDLASAYPAKAGGVEGYAVAHCEVERGGLIDGCQVTKESPERLGFGAAALAVARKFRLAPELAKVKPGTELWVDVPIRFDPPAAAGQQRTVASPTWLAGFDPDTAPKVFPPEAAAQGLSSGRGVARCVVAVDGGLTDCTPEVGDPDGMGFSEAAAKLASTMKMNPWSADAAPVDGAVVRVAIRLNLKKP
jgi:TonB family protein